MEEGKYKFLVEWINDRVKIARQFFTRFYPSDCSMKMYNVVSKITFRIKCEIVQLSDFFHGRISNVYSDQLRIIPLCDEGTAGKFSRDVEATVIIIKESGFKRMGKIISVLEKNNLVLFKGKMIDKDKCEFNSSFSERLEGRFLVIEIKGENAVNVLRKLLNPEAPLENPLNSDMGDLNQHCLGPLDEMQAKQEIKEFFPDSAEIHCNTTVFVNSAICIIKPHAVHEKIAGKIIQYIQSAGFQISAFEIITFSLATSTDFLDVYKGFNSKYADMVLQLMSGPCIALEVTLDKSSNVPMDLRAYVGPSDPEMAKMLRPETLRAVFGSNIVKNVVHCTDLISDALFELVYVFKVLSA